MYQGMILASFRGTQGSGVGLVADKDDELSVTKSYLSAGDWLQTQQWEWVGDQLRESHVIMGHTRYPTFSSTVYSKYAQPYAFQNDDKSRTVMMTHNGHINNYNELTRDIKLFTHPVDSAHIARALAENSVPKSVLETIKGGYALMWYDETTKSMYSAKNDARSLFIAFAKDKKSAYYCSEDVMLRFLLERSGIEYKEICEVPEMQIYQWQLDGDKLEPASYVKYKEKKAPVIVYQGNQYSGGAGGGSYGPHGKKSETVWASLTPGGAFTPYPGGNHSWGKIICSIPHAIGSICEVNSITQKMFDEEILRWFKDGNSFPVTVNTKEMEDDPVKGKYPFYRCSLDRVKLEAEITRLRRIEESKKGAISAPTFAETEWVPGPLGAKISKIAWLLATKEGCFHCTRTITGTDYGKIGWQMIQTNVEGEDLYQGVCTVCVERLEKEGFPKAS